MNLAVFDRRDTLSDKEKHWELRMTKPTSYNLCIDYKKKPPQLNPCETSSPSIYDRIAPPRCRLQDSLLIPIAKPATRSGKVPPLETQSLAIPKRVAEGRLKDGLVTAQTVQFPAHIPFTASSK